MPTQEPTYDPADNRFRIRHEHMEQLEAYRKRNKLRSKTAALHELLTMGFVQDRSERKRGE